jgi:hypothetical protein
VRVRPPVEPVAEALRAAPWARGVTDAGFDRLRVEVSSVPDAERGIVEVLARAGVRVVGIEPEAPDLESVFLELTS